MSNTPPIAGYRPLENTMIDMANQNKMIEELTLRQLDRQKSNPATDQRLNALANTYLQVGFMLMNRAVFQPTRIAGEIEIEGLLRELSQ